MSEKEARKFTLKRQSIKYDEYGEYKAMHDALVGAKEEEVDPEEIEVKVDDTEFWEWNYCLVYSNPDSHKVMRYLSKHEAV